MIKVLFVLAWPVGMAAIAAAAWLLARRDSGQQGAGRWTAGAVRQPRGHDAPERGGLPPPGRSPGRHGSPARPATAAGPGWLAGAARFCLLAIVGSAAVFAVMVPLGMLAAHAGPTIDKPFYQWSIAHQVPEWASVMRRATKIGNAQATWAAAGAAAACLAVTWRRGRWLPPLALGALFAVNKLVIHAIHHVVHRVGTPTAPLGTFPSGGSARAVAFYGLIAYLLWREFSGSRRGAVWATAAVAALGFNEGYSRGYLGLHWLTDILSGWAYGCLLLAVFVAAVRFAAGPARAPAGAGLARTAGAGLAETAPHGTAHAGTAGGPAPAGTAPAGTGAGGTRGGTGAGGTRGGTGVGGTGGGGTGAAGTGMGATGADRTGGGGTGMVGTGADGTGADGGGTGYGASAPHPPAAPAALPRRVPRRWGDGPAPGQSGTGAAPAAEHPSAAEPPPAGRQPPSQAAEPGSWGSA